MLEKQRCVCAWIGDGEGCRQPTIYGKAYCETHHNRIYISVFPEMADYMLEKQLQNEKCLIKII